MNGGDAQPKVKLMTKVKSTGNNGVKVGKGIMNDRCDRKGLERRDKEGKA